MLELDSHAYNVKRFYRVNPLETLKKTDRMVECLPTTYSVQMSKPNETYINIVKLCVGIDSVEHLQAWRAQKAAEALTRGETYVSSHTTRMWPKRERELLAGGSLYWVVKGAIQLRQTILGFDEVIGHDGIRRCKIVMDPKLILTHNAIRRPFQGWRYLKAEDAPQDLPQGRKPSEVLPVAMEQDLANLGVL